MNKLGYIYKITNLINGKSYIGKTNYEINQYIKYHFNKASRGYEPSKYLYNAIRKYGKENFRIGIIYKGICSDKYLNDMEVLCINYFDTYENGYNMTLGGDGINGEIIKGQNHPCSKANMSKEKRKAKAKKAIETQKRNGTLKDRIKKMIDSRKKNGTDIIGAKKIAENRIKNGTTNKESRHPKAKKYIIFSPHNEKYIVHGGLKNFCIDNNLSLGVMKRNVNKGKIKVRGVTDFSINTINWEIKDYKI